MSVVLRCPTCGTTQGHTGECEACSDGEVRYFCTNHDEGTWLAGPVCSRCGATFGARLEKPRIAAASTRPAESPEYRPPGARREPGWPLEPGIGTGRPEPDEPAASDVLPAAPSLRELLEKMAEERARARARHDAAEVPWMEPRTDRSAFPVTLPGGGCLLRVVSLVFLVIAALVLLLFGLLGGLFMY